MADTWTLAQVFARRAAEHPERPLVVAGGRTMTYGQADQRSAAMAAALSELGIGAGDRIAVNLPNGPEWLVALLASARLGAIVVPVSQRLNYHELKYQLRHAEVSAQLAGLSPVRRGELDFIAASWPELQAFMGTQEMLAPAGS